VRNRAHDEDAEPGKIVDEEPHRRERGGPQEMACPLLTQRAKKGSMLPISPSLSRGTSGQWHDVRPERVRGLDTRPQPDWSGVDARISAAVCALEEQTNRKIADVIRRSAQGVGHRTALWIVAATTSTIGFISGRQRL
jgi:hypothetical protein